LCVTANVHILHWVWRTDGMEWAAFSSAFLAVASSLDSSLSIQFPFRSCMIMNDLSAYHIKHTAAERAHIHMWGSTVHVFPLLLGVGRPSDFLFAIYPTSRYLLPRDFPSRRFPCCEHEYSCVLSGQGNHHIRFFRRLRLNGGNMPWSNPIFGYPIILAFCT